MRTDLRPSHTHRLCEQHFEEPCFDYVGNGTKVLKPKSLPTLFDLEVFYKMIAYQDKLQESNKAIKKTNITFHTSNPDLDGRTLEPILKMNLESGHVKTRLAPTNNNSPQESIDGNKTQATFAVNKSSMNHHDNVRTFLFEKRNDIYFQPIFSLKTKHRIVVMSKVVLTITLHVVIVYNCIKFHVIQQSFVNGLMHVVLKMFQYQHRHQHLKFVENISHKMISKDQRLYVLMQYHHFLRLIHVH